METKGVNECPVKVGDKVCLLWRRELVVTSVRPYTGKYKEHFKWTVKVALPCSSSGWLEYCL